MDEQTQTEETVVEETKVLEPVDVDTLNKGVELVSYKAGSTNLAEYGQTFAIQLIEVAGLEEAAQKALATAQEAKQYMAFELTKIILNLSYEHESGKNAVNIYDIFSNETKDVTILNRNILLHMGVQVREVNDDTDTVEYKFATKRLEDTYAYSEALKKKDEAEHTRRFNNRKRLNSRLSDAIKAACILRDQNLSTDDLFYSEDKDTGELVPTIKNAPKSIGGDGGIFQMNARKPVKGATLSPTMASLIKLATEAHKETSSKGPDKGETRDAGDINIGDEQFGKFINNVRNAVNALEGKYTEDMLKQMRSLHQFLTDTLKTVA